MSVDIVIIVTTKSREDRGLISGELVFKSKGAPQLATVCAPFLVSYMDVNHWDCVSFNAQSL